MNLALQLVPLKFPGCEASRMQMVAVPSELLASELNFDLHLLALHQMATNWASCSAPTVLRQVAIRRACGEQTIPDCFTGLFSETQLIRRPDNGPRFRQALHRLA